MNIMKPNNPLGVFINSATDYLSLDASINAQGAENADVYDIGQSCH